jgi:hypothetical protein
MSAWVSGYLMERRREYMTALSWLIIAGVGLVGVAGCNISKGKSTPIGAQRQQPAAGVSDWRERLQENHNASQSIEQQVRRLTRDLELTPQQQSRVRQLAQLHNARIQAILDTAPPTLTRDSFNAQVHGISRQFHDSVNAMLSPHQLELMREMVGRLDGGTEARRSATPVRP